MAFAMLYTFKHFAMLYTLSTAVQYIAGMH